MTKPLKVQIGCDMPDEEFHKLRSKYFNMRNRCYNPRCTAYSGYGAKGVKISERWDTVGKFIKWAIARPDYFPGAYIDRIDPAGDYSPDNCRFVTAALSSKNTRKRINITAFGETKTNSEWVADPRCTVKSKDTVAARIKNGWDSEAAIITPVGPKGASALSIIQKNAMSKIANQYFNGNITKAIHTAIDEYIASKRV